MTPEKYNRVKEIFLEACEKFTPLTEAEQEALIATANQYESVFALDGPEGH